MSKPGLYSAGQYRARAFALFFFGSARIGLGPKRPGLKMSSNLCVQVRHFFRRVRRAEPILPALAIMHLLWDCDGTLEIWEKLVDPHEWHLFASLGLHQWFPYNLQKAVIGPLRWNWAILFASLLHMLGIDHNHLVFSGKSSFPDLILPRKFGHVEAIETHLCRPTPFLDASLEVPVRWTPPPMDMFKLNTDGTFRNGLTAFGGLIRNHHGQLSKGFHCNFGTASSILAELWGFIHGLHLAKSLHITSLAVELVSKVVVNMIQKRSSHSAHLWPLLAEAFSLMEATYWRYSIAHVFREANFSVDTLVDMRRHGGFQCTVLDFPPACISLALDVNIRGVTSTRIVH